MCVFFTALYFILLSSFAFNIHMFGKDRLYISLRNIARINIWDVQTITRPRAIRTIRRGATTLHLNINNQCSLCGRAKSIIDHYSPLN